MTVELHIASRLKKLLPPLTTDEFKQLEANILADGEIEDAILYWNDGSRNNIVDGMHRFKIAQKHNLPYKTKKLKLGKSYDDAEVWMLDHQLGRRNLLKPQEVRRIRGELYNRLKRQDGGHGDQRSGGQNDSRVRNTARKVAKKAGVSESTVKRDGARVEALNTCAQAIQKGVAARAFKLTDAEVKTVSKLAKGDQITIATELRKGLASSVKQSMKQNEIKAPAAPKKKKPPKQLDRPAYYEQWEKAIGPLVRLVDKIASSVGESKSESHKTVQEHLAIATDEMMEWMGVK